jgi:hypothetical protein
MNDLMLFTLAALAVYRLAWLVAMDEGPFSLFATLRARVDPLQRTWLGRGLNCPVCVSFWLALALSWLGGPLWWLWWLALAGAALYLVRTR